MTASLVIALRQQQLREATLEAANMHQQLAEVLLHIAISDSYLTRLLSWSFDNPCHHEHLVQSDVRVVVGN